MKDEEKIAAGMEPSNQARLDGRKPNNRPAATSSRSTIEPDVESLEGRPKVSGKNPARGSCPNPPAAGFTSIGMEANAVIGLAAYKRKKRFAKLFEADMSELW